VVTRFTCLAVGVAACWALSPAAESAPPYSFSGGFIVFEAEDASTNVERGGQAWTTAASVAGYSGTGYVEALPNLGATVDTDWTNLSPELQYEVIFPSGGTYYVWASGYATDTSEDSVHFGLDGQTGAASRVAWTNYNRWTWTNGILGGGAASITVPSAGSHFLNLWMREDGARVDRVIVSSNPNLKARKGNSWHIPHTAPGVDGFMRSPIFEIYPGSAVRLMNGNQYQGGGEAGNQLQSSSAIYYRDATGSVWSTLSVGFLSTIGNDIFFSNSVPTSALVAGHTIEYYFKIAYSDYLTTYLWESGGVSVASDNENAARASPFRFNVLTNPPPRTPSPEDWRDKNIYFIFTDRFNDGNPANNNANTQSVSSPANSSRIHGGDFKGIEKKLDYIRAMGANAIWITPIPQNVGQSGYHGYGADDFYQLQPNWGTIAELTSMVASAHAKGIAVILDVVANHMGNRISSSNSAWNSTFSLSGYPPRWTTGTTHAAPFNQLTNFHNNGHIINFQDPDQVLGELSGLDDLRTETLMVRSNLVNIYKYWTQVADLDGFRLDTVKHVDIGMWQHFNNEMRAAARAMGKTNFFQFGEVYDGSDAKCGYYTGTKAGGPPANDSVVDYRLYFDAVNSVFATAVGGTSAIENRYHDIATYYDGYAQSRLVTFLDNHDRPRFMTAANANNNTGRLALALTFLYTARGIPCLYYGTEQNFSGNGDPANREDMWDGQYEPTAPSVGDNFNMTQGSYQHVNRLNNLRRNYPALRRGSHENLWQSGSPGLFAYARRLGTEEVFVVFNTASGNQTLTNRPTIHAAGTRLVNVLNTNEIITVTNGQDGIPPITLPSFGAKLFVAESQVKPLDPWVTFQSPSHAATNMSPSVSITLRFSKPMNTHAVTNAFHVTPSISGAFTWASNNTQMTFVPSFPGYAGSTAIVVRVETNAADSLSGNTLFAAFESYFHTTSSTNFDNVAPSVVIHTPATGAVVTGAATLSGAAGDNVGVQRVEFRLDAGDWFEANGTNAWFYPFDSALFLNGSHQLAARSYDVNGNVSTTAVASVKFFNVPGGYDVRVSAGNASDATNCDASVWLADRAYSFGDFGYVGGTNGFIGATISNICAEAQWLYQRERYTTPSANFRYLFHCPPGIYETTVLETETYVTGVGERVFDLYIQTDRVLTNYDIFAATGGMNLPAILTFTNVVGDALLEMNFLPQVQNARASGIRVRKIADIDGDADGIPDWWMRGWFDHPTGQQADFSLAGDDADGDGLSNIEEYLIGSNPLEPSPPPFIQAMNLVPGPDILFPSISGRVYDLEAVDALDGSATWTSILQNVSGNGSLLSLPDTNDADRRIYRVRVRMP
jgi:glycosidase